MERRAQFILVAVFLLLTVASVVGFIRWIKPDEGDSVERRLVQFDSSVSGLSVGSVVRYLGVPVGRVLDIALNRERAGRVNVEIGLDQPLPDSDMLVALLEPQGITGLSLVELRDRSPISVTTDVEPGIIPGQASILSTISNSAAQLSEQAALVLTRLNALLNEETIANFEDTVRQLREFTGNLSQASGGADALVASLTRVSEQLEATLPAYSSLALQLESDLLPTIVVAGESIQQTSDALAASVDENREEISQLLQQDLPSLIRLSDEFAHTLREISRLAKNVNNQPGALLYGAPVPEADIPLD
jgi:phospholipid/cholesterol/gamma-HCH transport system substrate-binding protein